MLNTQVLIEAMDRRGLNPRQLSLECGFHERYISVILRDPAKSDTMELWRVERIAEVLQLPLSQLSTTKTKTKGIEWLEMSSGDFQELLEADLHRDGRRLSFQPLPTWLMPTDAFFMWKRYATLDPETIHDIHMRISQDKYIQDLTAMDTATRLNGIRTLQCEYRLLTPDSPYRFFGSIEPAWIDETIDYVHAAPEGIAMMLPDSTLWTHVSGIVSTRLGHQFAQTGFSVWDEHLLVARHSNPDRLLITMNKDIIRTSISVFKEAASFFPSKWKANIPALRNLIKRLK